MPDIINIDPNGDVLLILEEDGANAEETSQSPSQSPSQSSSQIQNQRESNLLLVSLSKLITSITSESSCTSVIAATDSRLPCVLRNVYWQVSRSSSSSVRKRRGPSRRWPNRAIDYPTTHYPWPDAKDSPFGQHRDADGNRHTHRQILVSRDYRNCYGYVVWQVAVRWSDRRHRNLPPNVLGVEVPAVRETGAPDGACCTGILTRVSIWLRWKERTMYPCMGCPFSRPNS